MNYANDDLIERFVRGHEDGKANRMAIEARDDWTFLWGYGHALYGARSPSGTLFVYDGWNGRSNTTSTHMNSLKGKAKSAYGEPREDGDAMRVLVDGEGGGEVTSAPPKGHVLIIVEDGRPGTNYGRLDDAGRRELSGFADTHVGAPSGYGGATRR